MIGSALDRRHNVVRDSRVALADSTRETQIQKGLSTVERGVPLAIPVDSIKDIGRKDTLEFLNRPFWRNDNGRVSRLGTRYTSKKSRNLRDFGAAFLQGYTPATIENNLSIRHWHAGWANPFEPDAVDAPLDAQFLTLMATHWPSEYIGMIRKELVSWMGKSEMSLDRYEQHRVRQLTKILDQTHPEHSNCRLGAACPANTGSFKQFAASLPTFGFTEDLGWRCGALVTSAFVSEIVDELVSTTGTEFADFDFHEVGTSAAAESNAHTALTTTSGIARATGTPTDSDPDYVNVATITADATETWEEHGLFNNSTSVAMMDRNLTGGQAVVNTDQVEYTLTVTINPET